MKKKLLFPIITLLLLMSSLVMIEVTFGWISDIIEFDNNSVAVGDLRYTKTGAFIGEELIIYPSMELLTEDITLFNESSIDSQMRLKISYTKITNPTGSELVIDTVDYSDAIDDHLDVVFDSSMTYDTGYWYLGGTSFLIPADNGLIALISSIQYDGTLVGNDYSQQTVSITVTIEVKQNDHVLWSELTSYEFETGYPA